MHRLSPRFAWNDRFAQAFPPSDEGGGFCRRQKTEGERTFPQNILDFQLVGTSFAPVRSAGVDSSPKTAPFCRYATFPLLGESPPLCVDSSSWATGTDVSISTVSPPVISLRKCRSPHQRGKKLALCRFCKMVRPFPTRREQRIPPPLTRSPLCGGIVPLTREDLRAPTGLMKNSVERIGQDIQQNKLTIRRASAGAQFTVAQPRPIHCALARVGNPRRGLPTEKSFPERFLLPSCAFL